MSDIIFYEKPGCINNSKQKKLLKAAGYRLEVRDLLEEPWSANELRKYFGTLPVSEWFKLSAPAIKKKDVIPENLNDEQALALMVNDPLLIRRPLMNMGSIYITGFGSNTMDRLLNTEQILDDVDLETCSRVSNK